MRKSIPILKHVLRCPQQPSWAAGQVRKFNSSPLRTRPEVWLAKKIALPPHPPFYRMAMRAVEIVLELLRLQVRRVTIKDTAYRAKLMRESLIRLGPAFVKGGQALATRPDAFPKDVAQIICAELAKLQDQMPPFDSKVAMATLERELGSSIDSLFSEFNREPFAAASLGQVHQARLNDGTKVAVKIQRPDLQDWIVLDAHVLRGLAQVVKSLFRIRSDIVGVTDHTVGRILEEMDYTREADLCRHFGLLYRSELVDVPRIIDSHSTSKVLTMQWLEGYSLSDPRLLELGMDSGPLIELGVKCSLDQMLEKGFFHADPHPGNLMVSKEGKLVYLDFGMMGYLDGPTRLDLIRVLVNFVNKDAHGLAVDFKSLGFVPPETPLKPIEEALVRTFESDSTMKEAQRELDFQGVLNELSTVMADYTFQVPAHFTLVIRSLAALEGTVVKVDPEFKVVARAYPHVIAQLIRDRSPAMRAILSSLVLTPSGNIRWKRLERLIQEAEVDSDAVAAAVIAPHDILAIASDAIQYVLSDKGSRVRYGLVLDSVNAVDELLAEQIHRSLQSEEEASTELMNSITPVISTVNEVVSQAPSPWAALFVRTLTNPEMTFLLGDAARGVTQKSSFRAPQFAILEASKQMHMLQGASTNQAPQEETEGSQTEAPFCDGHTQSRPAEDADFTR